MFLNILAAVGLALSQGNTEITTSTAAVSEVAAPVVYDYGFNYEYPLFSPSDVMIFAIAGALVTLMLSILKMATSKKPLPAVSFLYPGVYASLGIGASLVSDYFSSPTMAEPMSDAIAKGFLGGMILYALGLMLAGIILRDKDAPAEA